MLLTKPGTALMLVLSLGTFGWAFGGQAPACGKALGAAFNEVFPLSNGPDTMGSSDSCMSPGQFGNRYQCVEFIKRYYSQALGVDTSQWSGHAEQYFSTAAAKGLISFPNGSTDSPRPNDILIFAGNKNGFGHVAIITDVTASSFQIVEQNWSSSGHASIPYARLADNSVHVNSRLGYVVLGWLRRPDSITSVRISPKIATLLIRGSQQFSAAVLGTGDLSVDWSIEEGASGGIITPVGFYTAPNIPGTYHIIATSRADSSKTDHAVVTLAAYSGSFSSGPNSSSVHVNHTATRLKDGRVLIAGTLQEQRPFAETFDPQTNMFAGNPDIAHDMIQDRFLATSTLLSSGKVLIAGGTVGGPGIDVVFTEAELFDPISNSFSVTGAMKAHRDAHTATLLGNGLVFVTGGYDNVNGIAGAELFDSANGTFSDAGDMTSRRLNHTATLLNDGRLLILGGQTALGAAPALASAEIYDPANKTFAALQSGLAQARYFHTATLLPDGRVLIAGGFNDTAGDLASIEVFDPTTNSFSLAGNLVQARERATATLLNDGSVLVAGGFPNGSCGFLSRPLHTAEIVQTSGNGTIVSSLSGDMITGRGVHRATLLLDGRVLLTGGLGFDPNTETCIGLNATEILK